MNKLITFQGLCNISWNNRSLKIMKVTLILFLITVQITASNIYSQHVSLTLSYEKTTVRTVVNSISAQTGYEFSYDADLLDRKIGQV